MNDNELSAEFENTKYNWESYDGWQFADRNAERKFFFKAGAAVGAKRERERCAKIAVGNAESQRNLVLGMDSADIVAYRIAEAIRREGEGV